MPFCPKCSYEYVEGINECPDCQIELVEELPFEEKIIDPDVELVALPSLPGAVYAEMVKEALEKEGISCFLQSDVLASAYGSKGLGSPGQATRIFVRKEDQAKAESILHQMLDHI